MPQRLGRLVQVIYQGKVASRDRAVRAEPGQAEPRTQLRQGGLSVMSQLRSALQGAANPRAMQARDWESDFFFS